MKPTLFGAQMRAFDDPAGIQIEVPDDRTGYRMQKLRAWYVCLHAGFPAAAKVLPFMESTSAHYPHRGIYWNRTH
eukprot:2643882-Pleurochrysis_carterae.AAC.1